MKKWLDKYDAPKAQNGIEGTMGGLTDKGFNYNGAWGGPSMAMGGSMPGAVGFTYARTGSIPSNGPYAKKTKASAQNGMEMKFYQEGLDWKPRNISRDGSEIPQAQDGKKKAKWQERLAEEVAKLDSPTSSLNLSKKGFSKDEIKTIQKAASKEQPVIQTPKGKQLTREQILQKNKEYAEAQGKRFDPISGAVTPFLSTSAGKAFDRANESVLNAANAALNVPTKLIQSAYKPGYTATDALLGKPSGSSLAEDIVTDPGMIASLGAKGLLKGALSKGMLSSAALPFYKSIERDPAGISAFTSKLNEIKDLLSTPEAKGAFQRVGEIVTRRPEVAALDQSYANAITNPDLPINAIDKYAKSITSIDPAENALSADQVKYLGNITSLATDFSRIGSYGSTPKQRLQFIIDNSKNISPRDTLPYFYTRDASFLDKDDKNELLTNLYNSYSGQSVNNPLAEYTAATDLFSLADTYGSRYSRLSDKLKSQISDLTKIGDRARPRVLVNDPYFDPRWENRNSQEAIHLLTREPYRTIPTPEERLKNMRSAGKTVIETVNRVLNDPSNKGKFFTGAHSLSTDSYPLTLGLFGRNKDILDFVPVHEGAPHEIATHSNSMGGLSEFNTSRRKYLNELKPTFDKRLGNIDTMGETTAGTRLLQQQMLESGLLNYHINEFNKKIGTNMPSAYFSGFYNELRRPNVGAVVKKQGGVVKDDMGQWAHPGEITEISSPYITMEGVPYPVLGISDTGDTKMMEPGKNYKFKGKKVTEYPMKKNGGWLDKYK